MAESSSSNGLSIECAQRIITKHFPEGLSVSKVNEVQQYGYSYAAGRKIYVIDLVDDETKATSCCFVTTAEEPDGTHVAANSLPVVRSLLDAIRAKTSIPIADSILDTDRDTLDLEYLLSPPSPFVAADIVSLREAARRGGVVTPQHQVLIDLTLGKYLAQLHTNAQNDWFGAPALAEPAEPSYSWQETFTALFEDVLGRVKSASAADTAVARLPYEEIQRHMCRAIAFFLFDDVEVPSLVWLTGSQDDIFVSLPTHPSTKTPSIAAILPSLGHAVWGDPLLETMFMDLDASTTLLAGYTASGGGPLISFARQKTKRLWYTIYLALLVLSESAGSTAPEQQEKREWALKTIEEGVALLKDSPCN